MERHWEVVTYRLSAAVAREVSAIVEIYNEFPEDDEHEKLRRIAASALSVEVSVLPNVSLPSQNKQSSLFALLDKALNK
jgi:two-component system osmolarity sensor histidine kinase EnvZ